MQRQYSYFNKGSLKQITIITDEKLRIFKVIQDNNNFVISFDDPNFTYFLKIFDIFLIKYDFIKTFTLELNFDCNLTCKHCYQDKNLIGTQLSFKSAKKIIDDAYMLGAFEIILSGGECTINKDFLKIANYINSKDLYLTVLTNGLKLFDDNNLFNNFVKLVPKFVQISLYSMNPDVHDFITGVKGSHFKTLSVINKLIDNNIKVNIACPILSYNSKDYKEVLEFAKSIGSDFPFGCLFINNPCNKNSNSKVSAKFIENFYFDFFNENKRDKFLKNDNFICEAGIKSLNIRPNLDITPCCGMNYIIGNLKTISLLDLKNTVLKEYKKTFIRSNLKNCFKHEYCKFCAYCSAPSTYESKFLKKSPTLCEDAKAYYSAYIKKSTNSTNE